MYELIKTLNFTLVFMFTSQAHAYPVYSKCEQPSSTFLRTVYVDAALGNDLTADGTLIKPYKTLTTLVAKKDLKGGDHLIVAKGHYVFPVLSKYNYPSLVGNTSWVWFEFKPGSVVSSIDMRDLSRVEFTGVTVTGLTSGDLVAFTNMQQVVFADSTVKGSLKKASELTAKEWLALPNGISASGGHCLSFSGNTISNIRLGVNFFTDVATYPDNGMQALFINNKILGFSGDASHGIASDLTFKNNKFIDGYLSEADGDLNHDDMFQGFALNGAVFQNLVIEGNLMEDRTSQTRKFLSDYQGISIFDGLYKNVVVKNNTVIVGAYHGISMFGVNGLKITNNTVVSSYNGTQDLWIGLFPSKSGLNPVSNTVSSNLAPKFMGTDLGTFTNNWNILPSDFVSFGFNSPLDMHLKTTSSAYGKGAGAL